MNDTTLAGTDAAVLRAIADEAFGAFNSGNRHVQPFSARYPSFTLDDAYREDIHVLAPSYFETRFCGALLQHQAD